MLLIFTVADCDMVLKTHTQVQKCYRKVEIPTKYATVEPKIIWRKKYYEQRKFTSDGREPYLMKVGQSRIARASSLSLAAPYWASIF
jgi:hypothetical protein